MSEEGSLLYEYGRVLDTFSQTTADESLDPQAEEIGTVESVLQGIATIRGLPGAEMEELIRLGRDHYGLVFNLNSEDLDVVLLDSDTKVRAGVEARRTKRILDVPVGREFIGRVVDPLGNPLDGGRKPNGSDRMNVEQEAPAIMDRLPVQEPIQTGITAVDALIPVGRGQRELILGDRQTGKTAIATDTIINQKGRDVICVYCAIGQRTSAVANVIADLRRAGAMEHCIVMIATGEDPPGLNFVAPFAATAMAEFFMRNGKDALIVYDDLTRHARSYRELSLLLRRPPAREAYPGDIFYLHSRLLERATHLSADLGGGSLTALPIVETEEQNMSAYIPTNLISITDGQIFLSPRLFQQGVLPAVGIGTSVSRVGGKTQLPAYRIVAGDLRLMYSQFEELENFARFGVSLDEETEATLRRGRRVREVLKQDQLDPIPVEEQIGLMVAVTKGHFDRIDQTTMPEAKQSVREAIRSRMNTEPVSRITEGETLSDEDIEQLESIIIEGLQSLYDENSERES
jgi:F-type H+/Na+-transporting ATPase subunit alpha